MPTTMSDGSSWRFIAERLNGDGTSTILDTDLPLQQVTITDAESDLNALNATINPEAQRMIGLDGKPLLQEWSTAIYAEKDNEIRGGGILAHSEFSGPSWALECVGFVGYAKDMPYTGNGDFFINEDTLDIARYIWDHIQGQVGGDIGLEFDQRKSGVLVGSSLTAEQYDPAGPPNGLTLESQAYKLAYYQDFDLLSNFDDLATATPYHYHERHYWDGGVIRHQVDFPTVLPRTRTDLRFAFGENIIAHPAYTLDGDDYASESYFLGAGEGARTIRGYATYPRTRLRRVSVKVDPSVRTVSAANGRAGNELVWRRNLEDLSEISIIDHPHAPIGAIAAGDAIYIQGFVDWLGDVGAWYKVTSLSVTPGATIMTAQITRLDKSLITGSALNG